jgi:protein-disulfide isomerase
MLAVPVNPRDHIAGGERARVTLVEYGDYQCPYCGEAFPIVEQVRRHFGDRLRFVFRHFPLTEVHPLAAGAAQTAEFAGSYDRFWQMHGFLYENQDQLSEPLLFAAAKAIGLSEEALDASFKSNAFLERIQADFMGGVRSGVNGTPGFFIQSVRHDGSYDFEGLVGAIDAVLDSTS